jgi:hypothetical protein
MDFLGPNGHKFSRLLAGAPVSITQEYKIRPAKISTKINRSPNPQTILDDKEEPG